VLPKERVLSKLDRALLAKYLAPVWPRVVLLGGLLCAVIGAQLANPQIAKTFIDQAQAGAPFDRLVRIAALFLVVALFSQVAIVLESYVAEDLGWRTTNALRADLTHHVLSLDGSFHTEHGAGELIERIDGDVSAIASFFSRFVVQVVGSLVFLVGVLVLIFREDVRIGIVLLLFAAGAFVFMTRGGGFVGRRAGASRRAAADLSAYVEERLGGLPDIKSSGADAYVMRRLHERLAARYRANADTAMGAVLFNGGIGLFFTFGTAATLALSAVLFNADAITLGAVYLVFRYTGMLRLPLNRLAREMNSFQQATGALVRIRELLAERPKVHDGSGAIFEARAHTVELDDVSFAYADEPVLRNVSFRIDAGEVLGMLGRTGSGKTTISRLLFRLHDAATGIVRLDGIDIRDAQLDVLRSRVALVTQDVQLFQGTVRDNVSLFDETITDARLRQVFAELSLDEWLDGLKAGLDTELGPHGRGLSAGEAQLVALARVFLKDPGLVVLDEASSRLDPATERLLERAISRLLEGRTAVVIAHRLATVERADRILILEEGRVAEAGRRADLAADPDSRFSHLLRAGMAEVLS
jgi:ABC-type multidrug transport system fused ATPase/permease subunit